jgi:hypothetical protein
MTRRGRQSRPSHHRGISFQELTDEALADLLKKRKQPVGLKAALKESVGARGKGLDDPAQRPRLGDGGLKDSS